MYDFRSFRNPFYEITIQL